MPNNAPSTQKSNPIPSLQQMFRKNANPAVKEWFENYLRGKISYYGLKTPEVREILGQWKKEKNLSSCSHESQLRICARLMALEHGEEKFAGIIYMQSLVSNLEVEILLDAAEGFYQKEYFFDWSTADCFTVRVLAEIIKRSPESTARIASWTGAKNLWQKRASIVALRSIVKRQDSITLIGSVIAELLPDSRRFIQTGIGWTLCDLSKEFPAAAGQIVEEYFPKLSREVIDRHTKHLPGHKIYKKRKRAEKAK